MRGAVNRRRAVRFAAAAAVTLLAGVLPGTDSAASGPDGAVTVEYGCRFPAGDQPITAVLVQEYPGGGAVGATIQPGKLTATVTVPKAAVAALLPAGAATASATAVLTTRVTQGASTADAAWPDLTAPQTPVGGDLVLTLSGAVPPLSVTAPGEVRFAAGRLDLTLHPRAATGTTAPPAEPPTVPPSGTPTDSAAPPASTGAPAPDAGQAPAGPRAPATPEADKDGAAAPATAHLTIGPGAALADVTGSCAPADGQRTVLGVVPVTGAPAGSPTPAGPGTPGGGAASPTTGPPTAGTGTPSARGGRHGTITLAAPPHSGVHDCPAPPVGEPDPVIVKSVPRPPTAVPYPGPGDPPFPPYSQCGFITGYANIGKLGGASVVNDLRQHPRLATIVQKTTWSDFTSDDPLKWYFEIDSIAALTLPPADATFLTYGFMPTSAKMSLVPRGLMTVVTVGTGTQGTISTSAIYGKQDLRLYDVEVNGTPLDVGPDCHTTRPLEIELRGYDRSSLTGVPTRPQDYSVQTGGPLAQDDLAIPPFTGCGTHGDDLDALFTSSISGHGNSLNLIQGPLCVPIAASGCDPEIAFPDPPHH
ncbi:DUF6801 domain-containing protein [Streptomyces sp. NBC_01190]|uniref:DUF6801 domain-containing protein n=1 Tax=Streptomyces sp. NBC_01190 TaxID=2903767 RepID=UPI003867C82A|nr:hypothetical protein OG519_08600 [Streptomyces sp. NBC_01190]